MLKSIAVCLLVMSNNLFINFNLSFRNLVKNVSIEKLITSRINSYKKGVIMQIYSRKEYLAQ